jgi:hypothetical protein
MIIYWNVHLATSVICIVTYVVDGLESQVDKTSHKTICLFFVQGKTLTHFNHRRM